MSHFQTLHASRLNALLNRRPGETKLGETIQLPETDDWEQAIKDSPARFVLLGIPEDIGVRANLGTGGAHTLWEPALKALLNVQQAGSLQGQDVLLLGAFDFSDWMRASERMDRNTLRGMVSNIDDTVEPVIRAVAAAGKIPIAIGGGHNNAYPLLKGVSAAKSVSLHCINMDAHTDYRIMEGRHSGNGFRYARHEGYLDRYAVVGLHRSYNSAEVLADFESDPHLSSIFFEDIFLWHRLSFDEATDQALMHVSGKPAGIELDLDSIEGILSSAATPSGFSSLQARQFVHRSARIAEPAYLHICEGATQLRDGRSDASAAKLAAYLVTDFIRACSEDS